MNLPDFAIRRPVTTLMMCLIAILLGGVAFLRIPVDLLPEITFPMLSVQASYAGVAPEEMETLVTRPLESAFAAVPGVEEITSTSSEGSSSIRIAFEYGTNLDEAADELRTRMDRMRGALPDDMESPVLFKFDVSQMPIMFLTVAAENMDQRELRSFVEDNVQYRLERVPGVAQVSVVGGLRREIHVSLELGKLRALDMNVADVIRIIQSENLNRPVGPVQEGRFEVLLRTQGEFVDMDEIRAIVVATRGGVPIYLRDIATVEDSHEEVRQMVTVDGRPAIRIMLNKQSGANTVEVSDAVTVEIERIIRDYPQLSLTPTRDSAEFIRSSISNVQQAAAFGAVLAVAVLLFFLRSPTATTIIGTAIPIALISTFALMYFNGFTLNIISFGGLALGVGMLVDNAIVVLENIYRHREEGMSRREAALKGSKEVAMAITASTLTTVAVFVPVVFTSGMSAEMFQQLAYVVSFALLASLVISLTVVPMLCSRYLPRPLDANQRPGVGGVLLRVAAGFTDSLTAVYGRGLDWALDNRLKVGAVAVFLFASSIYLFPLVGVELQPQMDEGQVSASIEMEPGTRVEETDAVAQRLAAIATERTPEAEHIQVETGSSNPFRGGGGHEAEIEINLLELSERSRSSVEIADDLRDAFGTPAGVSLRVESALGLLGMMSSMGATGGDRLEVEVQGHDLNVLGQLADEVRARMAAIPGVTNPNISRQPGLPEMLVFVDRAKASSMGLNVSNVADTLETAIGGRRASYYRDRGDEYQILVRLQEEDRIDLEQVGQIPISTPGGRTIPAESIIRLQRQEGPVSIARADQQRILIVSASISGRDLGSVVADLQESLSAMEVPLDHQVFVGGEWEEQQESFGQMGLAALLALILVYMVMASQFESLRDPFIILFSIPLAVVGVVALLLVTGTSFNIPGFLGIIVLVGIVVNNGIVLIDYTNLLRRDYHLPLREAVMQAGRNRLRPILMTTITTMFGMLPMAMGVGEGGEMQAPLARVVIGGLASSTLITLFILPVIYMALEERSERSTASVAQPEPAAGD